MPKVSKKSATKGGDHGMVVEQTEEFEGFSVNFIEYRQDMDLTPLLKGLPNDRCPCPHWGYVLKGRIRMRFADREEIYEAGDAFYAPPGHVPVMNEPGTQYVQFSPLEKMRELETVLMANVKKMQGG
jgi:mannose-6-phosphate isomerase-like protein (cupin superfamily)